MNSLPNDEHEQVHISDVMPGDTILINGALRTVCRKDIGRDPLMGVTLFGDCHSLGRVAVTRVTFGAERARRAGNG